MAAEQIRLRRSGGLSFGLIRPRPAPFEPAPIKAPGGEPPVHAARRPGGVAAQRQYVAPPAAGAAASILDLASRMTVTIRSSRSGVRRATGTEQLMASWAGRS